jgi:hypothetical protein
MPILPENAKITTNEWGKGSVNQTAVIQDLIHAYKLYFKA